MSQWLDLAGFDFTIPMRRNLDTLGIKRTICRKRGIGLDALPCRERETSPLGR